MPHLADKWMKMQKGGQRHNLKKNCKHRPNCPQSRVAVIPVPAIHPDSAQPMGRSVQSAARSTTLQKSAEVGEIELSMT